MYAEFIQATCLHLRKHYDLVPDYLEACLEPDRSPPYAPVGPGYANAEKLARNVVAASQRLKAEGFTPRFLVPSVSVGSITFEYLKAMERVPGFVASGIAEVSYHRYTAPSPAQLKAIAAEASALDAGAAMLEMIGADYEMLHSDLKTGTNVAWEQFGVAGYVNIDTKCMASSAARRGVGHHDLAATCKNNALEPMANRGLDFVS